MLGELAELGMEGARSVARLSTEAWAVESAEACARAHARIARAVRLTLMLQTKIIEAIDTLDRPTPAEPAADPAKDRKKQLRRIVERVAADERLDGEAVWQMGREVRERLDHDDIYGEVLTRPVSELIAAICQDLGLDPDWTKLAQEAWARTEMAGEAVGWPLAGLASSQEELLPAPSLRQARPPRRLDG
jgi:hypothetical protein